MSEVTNLIARDRPLMSMLGTRQLNTLFVEQLTDSYADRAANAWQEGVAFTDVSLSQPVRHYEHVQSFAKFGQVSDEQRIVSHINGDPFSYQVAKRLTELMNDVEHALHRGSAVTGATNAARQFQGLLNIFGGQSGDLTFTDSSGTTLTEQKFVDLLQAFADNDLGVVPSQCYVNSWMKRTISEYSTKITRNIDASSKMQMLIVERHTSDFGDVDILYSRDQLKTTMTESGHSLCFVDPSMFKVGWARYPRVEQLARDGLRDRFQINAHCTLLYDHEKGGGGGTGYVPYINQS